MKQGLSRRRVLRALAGALVGAAFASEAPKEAAAQSNGSCFWELAIGPYCGIDQEAYEYWCYTCCSGGQCEYETCYWYDVGTCT